MKRLNNNGTTKHDFHGILYGITFRNGTNSSPILYLKPLLAFSVLFRNWTERRTFHLVLTQALRISSFHVKFFSCNFLFIFFHLKKNMDFCFFQFQNEETKWKWKWKRGDLFFSFPNWFLYFIFSFSSAKIAYIELFILGGRALERKQVNRAHKNIPSRDEWHFSWGKPLEHNIFIQTF